MTKEESSNFYEIIKQNIYSSKQDKFIQLDEKYKISRFSKILICLFC